MKKKIIIALVVLAVGGFMAYLSYNPEKAPTISYRPTKVERGEIKVITTATGTVEPENRLEIIPPIAGRLDEILVKEGDKVKKNQIIAWMSSSERAALLDAARAKGESEVAYWEKLYNRTPIISPIDGTVILKSFEAGQTFSTSDAVITLSNRLTVKAEVDETDIGSIEVGQKATIILDAYSKTEFPAEVTAIAFDAETVNNVTIYEVDVSPLEPIKQMRSGMTANVNFITKEKKDILVIPTSAINYENGKPTVLIPNPPEKEPRHYSKEIQLGESDGAQSEVLSGLNEGDLILIKGLAVSEEDDSNNPLSFGPPKRDKKKSSKSKDQGPPPGP